MTAMFDATRALLGADVGGSLGSLGFPDAPAVASLVSEPTPTGTTVGLDVWHRHFGTVGLAGVTPAAPPAIVAGVIPYAVERALIGGDPASGTQPVGTPVSVGAVFETAAAQGVPTRLLAGSLPADVAYDPESQRLLRRALEADQLVVIPERAVEIGGRARLGWWLVDPVSGAAVDQMDDGGGQVIAQKVILIAIPVLVFLGLARFAPQVLCVIGIDAQAMTEAVKKVWRGDDSETPGTCGSSGPKPEPPGPTMRPMNPYSSDPPDQDPAHRQWLESSKDTARH
jgi:hypothetical protein